MRILFIGYSDPANVSHRVARALNRRVGPTPRARVVIVGPPHPFGYEEDIILDDDADGLDKLRDLLSESDWIINTGDGNYSAMFTALGQFGVRERDRRFRWATRHGGTPFRRDPDKMNRVDRTLKFERRFIAPDLYRFVQGDDTARPYLHAPDAVLSAVPTLSDPLRVCHSPSDPLAKGTDKITSAAIAAGVDFSLLSGPYEEIHKERRRHHVFIDQLNPDIGGFGASSMEALAAGLVTMCDVRNVSPQIGAWIPSPPIIPILRAGDIREFLESAVGQPRMIRKFRESSLRWAQARLSDAAIREYWISNLL